MCIIFALVLFFFLLQKKKNAFYSIIIISIYCNDVIPIKGRGSDQVSALILSGPTGITEDEADHAVDYRYT